MKTTDLSAYTIRLLARAALVGTLMMAFPGIAEDQSATIQALLKRIEELERKVQGIEQNRPTPIVTAPEPKLDELDQKVRVIERNNELAAEASAEKAKTATAVSLGASGLQIRSADTNFVLKVRGYVQGDARFYPGDRVDTTARDSFLMRRVRPIFEGTVFNRFDYRLMLDFGAQAQLSTANNALVQDAYVTARIAPEFQIQAGKMKEPVGLERLQSGANLLFIERSYPTQLVPNRDVGLQLQGELFDGALSYQAGIFNGTADGGSGDFDLTDDEKDFAGRVFARPFKNSGNAAVKGLGVGVAGTYGQHEGAPRPYVSAGLQRFFGYRSSTTGGANVVADGAVWRLAPQAYWYWGPLGVLGEYVLSSTEVRQAGGGAGAGQTRELLNTGWQVAASWFLTGEDNTFAAVNPRRPVTLSSGGGWGAWELAARVGQLQVDDDAFPVFADPATSAREALSYAVGINWHLNRNIKVSFDYEHTDFDAAAGNPYATKDEDIVLGRVQFGW